jgi:hypothetical protein
MQNKSWEHPFLLWTNHPQWELVKYKEVRNSHWLSYLKVVYIMAIRIENCKKQRFWLPSIKAKTAKLIMMVAKWHICFEILRLES